MNKKQLKKLKNRSASESAEKEKMTENGKTIVENEEEEESMSEDEEEREEMAKLDFEFEAVPPAEEDMEDVERLLTQIFLQADVDKGQMAKVLIDQSPVGCVFRPAEDSEEDEEGEAITYGVLSVVPLSGAKRFQSEIATLILQRAKKHSTDEIFNKFDNVLGAERMSSNVGFLVNERMLNFPAQIAGPAFHSLIEDYNSLPMAQRFEHILAILKVRICREQCATTSSGPKIGNKRKLGKAERKQLAIGQTSESDIIFDNLEEQLLFEQHSSDFPFFQYSVESEIEKSSKFHSTRRGGRTFRPFRRVCLLTIDQFLQFASSVVRSYSI